MYRIASLVAALTLAVALIAVAAITTNWHHPDTLAAQHLAAAVGTGTCVTVDPGLGAPTVTVCTP